MPLDTNMSIRLTERDLEMLDRYMERHHLDSRSAALRIALRSILNLEEGESVILRPEHPTRKTQARKLEEQAVADRADPRVRPPSKRSHLTRGS